MTATRCRPARRSRSSRASASIPPRPTPDLTVALSREPADHKIFVQSANFTEQDAAALFAVIWRGSRLANAADGRTYATRR